MASLDAIISTLTHLLFLQVNQPPAAQTPVGSVVREMEPSCLQWAASAQTQTARYNQQKDFTAYMQHDRLKVSIFYFTKIHTAYTLLYKKNTRLE